MVANEPDLVGDRLRATPRPKFKVHGLTKDMVAVLYTAAIRKQEGGSARHPYKFVHCIINGHAIIIQALDRRRLKIASRNGHFVYVRLCVMP